MHLVTSYMYIQVVTNTEQNLHVICETYILYT